MKKNSPIIIGLLLGLAFSSVTYATTPACVLLGSKPSFLVRLPYQQSNLTQQTGLSSTSLTRLSNTAKLTFTGARAMSGGRYIVAFKPVKKYGVCYPAQYINAVRQRLLKNNQVEQIDANTLLTTQSVKNTGLNVPTPGANQWDLSGNTAAGGIDAPAAWEINTGSPAAITAVLDNGILTNDSLTPNLNLTHAVSFFNSGSFTTGATSLCSQCNSSDHGTHVAGSVASSGNGAYGEAVFGVAYTSQVLPVNVFSKFTASSDCARAGDSAPCLLAFTSDIENALAWVSSSATFTGLPLPPAIVAVNMSLGGTSACSSGEQSAINALQQQNVAVVVAAGNSNVNASSFAPANCQHVISVAATGPTNAKADYSNWGASVAIAAPGGDLDFPAPSGIYSTTAGGYGFKEGTSMAAPHVAGLISLLYSVDPTLTPAEVLTLLQSHVTQFTDGGTNRSCAGVTSCGSGIINAGQAVSAALQTKPSIEWTPNFIINQLSQNSAKISWSAATWSNQAATPMVYTVKINGVASTACTEISATNCTVENISVNALTSSQEMSFSVEASDGREIFTPDVKTSSIEFEIALTKAVRNPMRLNQAWVYYTESGIINADDVLTADGLTGTDVEYDPAQQRFVVNNIQTGQATPFTLSIHTPSGAVDISNQIILPAIM